MQTDAINKIKYELKVFQDEYPTDPREDDNIGTMVCFHRRYTLGDKHDYCFSNYNGWEEMKEDIIKQEDVHTILPLYLYDHSGITMNTTGFSCGWDSGQVGWIFVSKEKVKEEQLDETRVEDYLRAEVTTYDQFLTGDVYGYKIYKVEMCNMGHEHKTLVDSCFGFYGEEYAEEEGKSMLEYYNNRLNK